MSYDYGWTPGETLADVEKKTIIRVLQFYNGNRTRTASALNISIRTLQNKLLQYGVNEKKEDTDESAKQVD